MKLPPIQIFRAGTHTDQSGRTLTFAESDLSGTASAYSPSRHEAPLVVGHPATDAPAYGWTEQLALKNGTLEAVPHQVDPQFAEMVNAGRFKKISASFWLPDAPGNPVPGVYYLRHIGFLGAAAPAIKGLRSPAFADDPDNTTTIDFAQEPPMPDSQIADFAAREAALAQADAALKVKADAQAEKEQALKSREEALAKTEAEQRRKAATEFADEHAKAGRILPRQQAGLTELLLTLPANPLEFSEGDGTTAKIDPRAWLEKFVAELPTQVDYAERTAGDAEPPSIAPTLSRKAFEALDPASRKAHLDRGGKVVD